MAIKPDASAGFSTGAKLLIVFMLTFLCLGYSVFLSICLGAIASSVSGFIASWWYAKEDYGPEPAQPEAATASAESLSIMPAPPKSSIGIGFGLRSAKRARHRRTRAQRRFGWFFRRNKS